MSLAFNLSKPFLRMMPGEMAHNATLMALDMGLGPRQKLNDRANMRTTLFKRNFTNPIGLAAGFDKNGEVIKPCFKMGFGFVEAGTVTVSAQAGNTKPRIHRFPKHNAVINHLGFPNNGLREFRKQILGFKKHQKSDQILGINIVKDRKSESLTDDYVTLVKELGSFADFIGVNVSCPNVPEFTNMQDPNLVRGLLERILEAREYILNSVHKPAILIKLSPDLPLEQLQVIADLLTELKIDGVILTNTTKWRPDHFPQSMKSQQGGMSGAPLKDKSTQMISDFYKMTDGKMPIIGLGGIASAEDAWEKITAGASLIQLYTGLIYKGPDLLREIYEGVSDKLESHGLYSLKEAVGLSHKKKS